VRVIPRGRRDEIVGLHGDAPKVRLTAPVEGKAHHALRVFLAERLGISPVAVEILGGHSPRRKRVRVVGVSADAVRALAEANRRSP
jgi:uncharacterized protein YggU (UPF0235/DUF167 family)